MIIVSKGWESILLSKYLFFTFSKLKIASFCFLQPLKPPLFPYIYFLLYISPIYLLLESNGTERPRQRETVEGGGN